MTIFVRLSLFLIGSLTFRFRNKEVVGNKTPRRLTDIGESLLNFTIRSRVRKYPSLPNRYIRN